MELFTWNVVIYCIIQNAWEGIQGILQENWLRIEAEVGRSVIFDKNPTANRALYKMVSLKSSFYTILSHTVCVMPFLAIFYRENAAMPIEVQDFATGFLSGMLHGKWRAWLCLFFSKKNAIFGVQRVYKKKHEIVWNMMMIHGYAYFLQEECYFICGVQGLCKGKYEIVWNMMHLWNSLKYDAIMK